jgi:hypothetical protein
MTFRALYATKYLDQIQVRCCPNEKIVPLEKRRQPPAAGLAFTFMLPVSIFTLPLF